MDERCELTDLPRITCGHCNGRTGDSPPKTIPDGVWTDARYHGTCRGCGHPIRPGDRIKSDGAGGWICADCGQ